MPLVGVFIDNILERLDYSNIENKKPDRRNILVSADSIRSEKFSAGNYSATKVNGQWQYNIGSDVKELPGILFTSKKATVLEDCARGKYYSVLPFEIVTFKNKNGIRTIHPVKTNTAAQGADINQWSDDTSFAAQELGAGVAYGLLESARLTGRVGYEIEFLSGTPGVIYYNNFRPGFCNEVLITALPRLNALSEDDMMPMTDEFAEMLEDETVAKFMFQKQATRDLTAGT